MKRYVLLAALSLAPGLGGCGLESLFANSGHEAFDRPASKITGKLPEGATAANITVIDGEGNVVAPFLSALTPGGYELRLPSAKYSMLRVRVVVGNMELRAVLPSIGEESAVTAVDLDARNVTETLIAEAALSHDEDNFKRVTPEAYEGTRKLIRAAFDQPGPTQELLGMVERMMQRFDKDSSTTHFFREAKFDKSWMEKDEKESVLDSGALSRNPYDYVGDGKPRSDAADFTAKLVEVAKLYKPAGCDDPNRIRVVFTVDMNQGAKNGLCGSIDRFKWARDKPTSQMFFVGWIYTKETNPLLPRSDIYEEAVDKALGKGVPNTIPMYDDGTNGDEKAGDNIWSIYMDLPRSDVAGGKMMRIGYKYTWGTTGAGWTGTEEWPGNSRVLEIADANGDSFVYVRDVFGDEATNKDLSNSAGAVSWTTDPFGCGPVTRENSYDSATCKCLSGGIPTPKWLGPLKVTCTQ